MPQEHGDKYPIRSGGDALNDHSHVAAAIVRLGKSAEGLSAGVSPPPREGGRKGTALCVPPDETVGLGTPPAPR